MSKLRFLLASSLMALTSCSTFFPASNVSEGQDVILEELLAKAAQKNIPMEVLFHENDCGIDCYGQFVAKVGKNSEALIQESIWGGTPFVNLGDEEIPPWERRCPDKKLLLKAGISSCEELNLSTVTNGKGVFCRLSVAAKATETQYFIVQWHET